MLSLFPMPHWYNLHPLVIHFPIVLLMIAPLFIILAFIFRTRYATLMYVSLLLMVMGVISTYVAVGSGEAAAELVDRTPAISAVLGLHEELAETTSGFFSVLALVLAAFLFVPRLVKRSLPRWANIGFFAAFLIAYTVATLFLVDTAHNGGRLVHEFGVHSIMAPEPLPSPEEEESSALELPGTVEMARAHP